MDATKTFTSSWCRQLGRRCFGPIRTIDRWASRLPFRLRGAILGALVTVAVLVGQWRGCMVSVENRVYDARVRWFGPKSIPTAAFVHVDVDDGALAQIGRWPWPRRVMADAIDVLNEAGADLIALDVLYPEAERTGESGSDGRSGSVRTRGAGHVAADDDRRLIEAVARAKDKVVLPTSFTWSVRAADHDVEGVVLGLLRAEPAIDRQRLRDLVVSTLGRSRLEDVDRVIHQDLTALRQETFLDQSFEAARARLRQIARTNGTDSDRPAYPPPLRIVDSIEQMRTRQFEKACAIVAMWDRFTFPGAVPFDLLKTRTEDVPIEPLVSRSAGCGFADYVPEDDGVVRSVPLWVSHRGQAVVPQFGLAIALAKLGIRPGSSVAPEIHSDRVILRPPNGIPIVIPVSARARKGGATRVESEFLIPWSGDDNWLEMYGKEGTPTYVEHLPFARVWQVAEYRQKLERNRDILREAVAGLRRKYFPKAPLNGEADDTGIEQILASDDLNWEFKSAEAALGRRSSEAPDDKADASSQLVAWVRVLREAPRINRELEVQLREARQELADQIRGKVVIVGWAATGAAADLVPTSLHARCPGSAIHGAIYNAIMTGNMWTRAAPFWDYVSTLAIGLILMWIMFVSGPRDEPDSTDGLSAGVRRNGENPAPDGPSGRLFGAWRRVRRIRVGPMRATILGALILLAWFLINGMWLFGRHRYVVDLTPGLLAGLSVWTVGMAATATERFRMMQLLRGYVDPKLIRFLAHHPENDLFDTRETEVTVCFSDIQGFTTLTQELGARMVPLLQDYLSLMVDVIRKHGGLVNKFMGDGIMFIFGVPRFDANGRADDEQERRRSHAAAALRCVLEMQRRLEEFNRSREAEFPPLVTRCGVNTGRAFVGDAGPRRAREYTALGDTTNVAARLESVNKDCGTGILVSQSTKTAVIESEFCFRAVGKLKVRNRDGCVEAFELVGAHPAVTEQEKDRARMLQTMIDEFQRRHFRECLVNLDDIEAKFGTDKLMTLYRERSLAYLQGTPPGFEGQILEQG